ncbi:nucleotide exchange factor GrpE [Anaerosacchariphilus sp. NSJ-68]|uniref:Protein GrpE n=2 Tax=Lachnospiraceae TaxID=186803 RepID=A0A923LCC4_9FIRM|nr:MULTISPECIES: nucleotide exchange factor GrpE [Lachnospiraceae]MBC5659667.1 nucleotide exchange factor GrpE [Anaerosacchariphilus hominis]MBC5697334.1 nucleotide exchange factor GrpE [Roseburia difficilis]
MRFTIEIRNRKGQKPVEQEIKNEEFQNEAAKEVTEEVKEEETATAAEASEEKESTGGEKPEETEAGEEPEMLKKKKKKDKMEEKIEELEDRVKRQMAEFDNFRKRTEKEKSHMYEVGARDVIEKILPVVDNFERGLASVPEDQKENPVIVGMDKIYSQLMTTLTDLGVEPIAAVGEEFDPNYHNAVMHVEDEELGENVVAEEFQKGYMYKDTVIRHSMVKVAN